MPPRPATWRRAALSAPLALGLVACALSCETFSSSGDVTEAGSDAPVAADDGADDGATKDAAVGATDAPAADGGMNLFPLGDFEVGGCTGTSYFSSLTADSTAHSGSKSCRVCSNGPSMDVYSFDTDIDGVMPPMGARYLAEVWVRNPPSGSGRGPASGVELALRTHNDGTPVTVHDNAVTSYTPLADAWRKLTILLDVRESGIPKLELVVDGRYDMGTCFLIDDIVVRRE